ncbi:hypothetical protein CELD12_15770 [Cellulomonas sp. NTE-D12]|nr:hypothetical protein CELD12_15770 [Cellulomonas sp. NTE-D12]
MGHRRAMAAQGKVAPVAIECGGNDGSPNAVSPSRDTVYEICVTDLTSTRAALTTCPHVNGSLTRFPGQVRLVDHAAAVAAVWRSSKSFGDR